MRSDYLVISALLAGLAMPAAAQQPSQAVTEEESAETAEPIRRYTVEVIIFAYDESVSAGTEVWIPDEPDARAEESRRFGFFFSDRDADLTEIDLSDVAHRYMDVGFELLREDDYTMNGIYRKLVNLDAYEPLVRAGWTQATFDKAVTAPIPLDRLAESPPWLGGSLTLYLGRYLHLVVDLRMSADRSALSDDRTPDTPTFGDRRLRRESVGIDEGRDRSSSPVQYHIFEDRIMKSGDLRYFDHPKFGMIAKVTRFEEPEILDDTGDLLPGGASRP
jgi:hypothetical protein